MKSYTEEHELTRQKLWADVWAATASANDCKSPDTATAYADAALKAFDLKFTGARVEDRP